MKVPAQHRFADVSQRVLQFMRQRRYSAGFISLLENLLQPELEMRPFIDEVIELVSQLLDSSAL